MTPEDAGRYHRSIDVVHSMTYFVPETEEYLVGAGLRPGRMCYFAGRSAPMGAVSAGVVAATFYNFNPTAVARHLDDAWALATPTDVVSARFRSVDAALRRMLGPAADAPDIAEAAALARTAAEGCAPEGRPLYAGHADLNWPGEPLLDLWHATSLLREHRGDGHVIALAAAGLTGLEALITHTAGGQGFTVPFAQRSRGWSGEEWDAGAAGLVERGLLDPSGALTPAGVAVRSETEARTNRLAVAPWAALGPAGADRLAEIGARLSEMIMASGLFPPAAFAPGSPRHRA
jgi:hypothetical protein